MSKRASTGRDGGQSFEWLRDRLEGLPPAAEAGSRDLVWVDDGHLLAVARNHRGEIEIFVVGDELVATSRPVRAALAHQLWAMSDGGCLEANRLVLSDEEHFDGVAAFICAELIHNGLGRDPAAAFARTEPAIALALRRATLADTTLLGLIGELVLLDSLTQTAAPSEVGRMIAAWRGYAPSSRDFQIDHVGVEVKTTTRASSVHHIQGMHQVEPGASVDFQQETSLFLLSIGVNWVTEGSDLTVSRLVDSICARASVEQDREVFLARVRQYGGDASIGYDHRAEPQDRRFRRPFELRFERLYDLSDPAIEVLRSDLVHDLRNVDAASVSYQVMLPSQVRGEVNPVNGLAAVREQIYMLLS